MYRIENSPSKNNCVICSRPLLYASEGWDSTNKVLAALHADWHQLVDILEALPEEFEVDLEMMPQRVVMGPPKRSADGKGWDY